MNPLLQTSRLLTLAVGLSLAAVACGTEASEDGTESSEDELRALDAKEVVGNITYGTSNMEVQHPGETSSRRTYVAVRFEANAGDEIEATTVSGNAADPVLYLLGSNFQTLKSNDDARPGDESSAITHKIARAGTYYLAMRTKEGWRTKFYVSLKKKGAPAAGWNSSLGSQNLWGARFESLIPVGSSIAPSRVGVACKIAVAEATIRCSSRDFLYDGVTAPIQADGSFAVTTGTATTSGGELRGNIAADGTVTLERWALRTCFQTSQSWCERSQTDGQNLPAKAQAFELCRTRDMFFPSGGYALGSELACSECSGQCEGGR
jgi:hypothetical protein